MLEHLRLRCIKRKLRMRLFESSCKVFLGFMKLLLLIASQIDVTVKKLSTYRPTNSIILQNNISIKIHKSDLLRIFSISILSQNVWILENKLLFKLVRMIWTFYNMFLRDTRGQWIYDTAYIWRCFACLHVLILSLTQGLTILVFLKGFNGGFCEKFDISCWHKDHWNFMLILGGH
jgi:hypothetical protein